MMAAPLGAVIRLNLWRYRVPLREPVRLGAQHIDDREGLLLEWRQEHGRGVWSEIAPLPGFSRESLPECITQCRLLFAGRTFRDVDELVQGLPDALAPSVRFGLESGGLQLSRAMPSPDQVHGCRLLGPDTPIDRETLAATACVKLKVGRGKLSADLDRIRRTLDATGPGARLRLDANRSWSLEQAAVLCDAIDGTRVEYLEEPLKAGLPYAGWAGRIALAFAWDETLREEPPADLGTPGLGAVVLKPMLTGLARTRSLVDQARAHGIKAVLSAAYESNLALDFHARLAALWGLEGPHGLDTFGAFSMALLQPPTQVQDGIQRPIMGRERLEYLDRLL